MRTIAVVNQKGGSGKTTASINLAAVLARRGLRVLLVDMDPQGHCAAGLGVPEQRIERSIADALLMELHPAVKPLLKRTMLWGVSRNLDLAPSTVSLAGLEAAGGGLHSLKDKDRRLAALLELFADDYDICLIDCPPTIGLLTFNALRACREALMPVETGYFALRGAERQAATIDTLMKRLGRSIAVRLLPTLYDPKSALAGEILATIQRRFADSVVPIVIHEHDQLREAASLGQPIVEYAPDSPSHRDFERLATWIIENPPPPAAFSELPDVAAPDSRTIETSPLAAGDLHRRTAPSGGRAAELARKVRERLDRPDPALPSRGEATACIAAPTIPAWDPSPVGFGVTCTPFGVEFVQPGETGHGLAVVGDFNCWSETPMHYVGEENVHKAVVQLPPGRYHYRLVIDGRTCIDPHNVYTWPNEFGEEQSVFIVEGPQHR